MSPTPGKGYGGSTPPPRLMIDKTRIQALMDDVADRIATHKGAAKALEAARAERYAFPRRSKAKTALWLEDIIPALERHARDDREAIRHRHEVREKWRKRQLKRAHAHLVKATDGTDDIGSSEADDNSMLRLFMPLCDDMGVDEQEIMQRLLDHTGLDMSLIVEAAIKAGDRQIARDEHTTPIGARNRFARQVQALADFRNVLDDMI